MANSNTNSETEKMRKLNPTLLEELYAIKESREKEIEQLEAKIQEINERIEHFDKQIHEEELKPEEEDYLNDWKYHEAIKKRGKTP